MLNTTDAEPGVSKESLEIYNFCLTPMTPLICQKLFCFLFNRGGINATTGPKQILDKQISRWMDNPMLECFETYDTSHSSHNEPQRKRSAIGLRDSKIGLLPRRSLSFWPSGTLDLSVMQVCNPPKICQANNQNPPQSTVILDVCQTFFETKKFEITLSAVGRWVSRSHLVLFFDRVRGGEAKFASILNMVLKDAEKV